jgi:hypothetical protein
VGSRTIRTVIIDRSAATEENLISTGLLLSRTEIWRLGPPSSLPIAAAPRPSIPRPPAFDLQWLDRGRLCHQMLAPLLGAEAATLLLKIPCPLLLHASANPSPPRLLALAELAPAGRTFRHGLRTLDRLATALADGGPPFIDLHALFVTPRREAPSPLSSTRPTRPVPTAAFHVLHEIRRGWQLAGRVDTAAPPSPMDIRVHKWQPDAIAPLHPRQPAPAAPGGVASPSAWTPSASRLC